MEEIEVGQRSNIKVPLIRVLNTTRPFWLKRQRLVNIHGTPFEVENEGVKRNEQHCCSFRARGNESCEDLRLTAGFPRASAGSAGQILASAPAGGCAVVKGVVISRSGRSTKQPVSVKLVKN